MPGAVEAEPDVAGDEKAPTSNYAQILRLFKENRAVETERCGADERLCLKERATDAATYACLLVAREEGTRIVVQCIEGGKRMNF